MPVPHKPQQKPVVVTRRLQIAAGRVWDVMATPGAVALYHPFCCENPVVSWPGVGAQDAIHYLSGLILQRRFMVWDEGRAYELEIGKAGWPTSYVRWELLSAGVDGSELTISIWPGAIGGKPSALQWVAHRWYLVPLLRRYLVAVLRGLDEYLTTGREVAPNQFGKLWLFSYDLRRAARAASST